MALNPQILSAAIEAKLVELAGKIDEADTPAQSRKLLADGLADAVHNYLLTATVTTTVVGSSPSGPVTGTGTGNLN